MSPWSSRSDRQLPGHDQMTVENYGIALTPTGAVQCDGAIMIFRSPPGIEVFHLGLQCSSIDRLSSGLGDRSRSKVLVDCGLPEVFKLQASEVKMWPNFAPDPWQVHTERFSLILTPFLSPLRYPYSPSSSPPYILSMKLSGLVQ